MNDIRNFADLDPESLWYNMVCKELDPLFYIRNRIQGSECLRLKNTLKKEPALDLGCGHGTCWPYLSPANIIGVDISIGKYAKERARKYGVHLIKGDAHNLPIRNNALALVVCQQVLEHLENPFLALKEISRSLKDDGIFILDIPCVLDKITAPAMVPVVKILDKILRTIYGNKENTTNEIKKKEDIGVVQKSAKIIEKIPSRFIRLLALRLIWFVWSNEAAREEHLCPYGWSWINIVKNAGFTIDKLQAAAIFRTLGLLLKNLEGLYRFESKIRDKHPFKMLGEIMCITAHKNRAHNNPDNFAENFGYYVTNGNYAKG